MKERAGIQSVEVGFGLLDVLAQAPGPLMLRDLAGAANMSAAKAHRYLVSYQRLGLVLQDGATSRYDLGPAATRLGLAALARLDAVKLARGRAAALALELGHTVGLAVWGNHGPTVVHWEESPLAVRVNLRLGDVMPLLSSATGLCFAAHVPLDAIESMLQVEFERARTQAREDVAVSMAQLKPVLADVRQLGLARVRDTLLPGIAGLCAPVFDSSGHMVLGLLSLGPSGSFDTHPDGATARALIHAAGALSKDLGYG